MDEKRIAELLHRNFGLRIEPEMQRYARGKIELQSATEFLVIGGDARTGMPTRMLIEVAKLRAADRNSPAS